MINGTLSVMILAVLTEAASNQYSGSTFGRWSKSTMLKWLTGLLPHYSAHKDVSSRVTSLRAFVTHLMRQDTSANHNKLCGTVASRFRKTKSLQI